MDSQQNAATAILEQLNHLTPKLSSNDDSHARKDALHLARQLVVALEQPENIALDLIHSPLFAVAARIAIHLNLFKHISNSSVPITSDELASLSGGEELLIVRLLRPLAATGFVKEVAERTWAPTGVTFAMAKEEIASGHRVVGDTIIKAASSAPKYFKEAGYQCPVDPHDGLMQYGLQTKLTIFELFDSTPEMLKDFTLFMGNTMGARHYWMDWFPVEDRLFQGATEGSPLLVDVGGGKGHDLIAFHEKYPQQGGLILQDMPSVIEQIEGLDPAINTVKYNFFTEQPVKGARAYFYHHILHDWSDIKCLEILEGLKPAMTPGYSKLLLHELIIPEVGASKFYGTFDLAMMAFNSGMERTKKQWEELLNKAGFKVVKFWDSPRDEEDGIVEAMLEA
ncbi:putative O-methyltransferase [Xylaria intraflava]|nr:putative O-methyltransferase [Xylaria intraflava]